MSPRHSPLPSAADVLSQYIDVLCDSQVTIETRHSPSREVQDTCETAGVGYHHELHEVQHWWSFEVNGLRLAIPRERVALRQAYSVQAGGDSHRARIGITLDEQGRSVPVYDVASVVFPEFSLTKRAALQQTYGSVVILHKPELAIAFERTGDERDLSCSAPQWTGEGSTRPWLAGLIDSPPCVLLDIDALAAVLRDW
ncbi:MAG: hypothetical protein BMS9Abin36_1642 [Gammaproteobacteria bacterium]|nr:MAG: hypothetical protein BMS9Abin36_1642 [Gammaproteobacteria bacterium]